MINIPWGELIIQLSKISVILLWLGLIGGISLTLLLSPIKALFEKKQEKTNGY